MLLSVAMATATGGWVLPQGVVAFNRDNGRGNSGVQRGKRQTVLERVVCRHAGFVGLQCIFWITVCLKFMQNKRIDISKLRQLFGH